MLLPLTIMGKNCVYIYVATSETLKIKPPKLAPSPAAFLLGNLWSSKIPARRAKRNIYDSKHREEQGHFGSRDQSVEADLHIAK
uniref:Uncharacterized protein n=1 Tax=Oryza brachyantha TaxID=4533 RepID=J3LXM2_ORYBR